MLKNTTISNIGLLLIAIALLVTINALNKNGDKKDISTALALQGKQLAEVHCSTCHAFPKAEILPTHYWGKVLPIMGFFLGAGKEKFQFADYLNPIAKERLTASGLFPEEPLISTEDWIAINTYYLKKSPPKLAMEAWPPFDRNFSQFSVEALPWNGDGEGLSFLNFNNGQYDLGFYKEKESYYLQLDTNGKELERTKIPAPLADVHKKENKEYLLLMGKIDNIDVPTGKILQKKKEWEELIAPLERPINFEIEDFDNDGIEEILVAEFGKFIGGINLYTQKDAIEKRNIHNGSGAVKTIIKDVNNDGLKDFYVLVTQADESIYLFLNKGNLNFDKIRLLRMPAHYGTTHFEVVDIDGDGDTDIICSSGDSGDFGIIPKPFHGVRLFENKGKHQYEQVWFHPQQGAYGTASADYDQDGDIDIASIGYFAAHFKRDKELFIYFENQSNNKKKLNFIPHGVQGKKNDCWILITNADVDKDGDLDIILGANAKILSPERRAIKSAQWQKEGGMVTVLKNNFKSTKLPLN